MYVTKKVRLNRLLNNGRCLDVAIDHGVCNEPSFMNGLEDMEKVVRMLVAAGPDAIQMNYGQSDLLQTFRRKVAAAKHISRQEANTFIADYVAGLEGYTYLEGEAAQ